MQLVRTPHARPGSASAASRLFRAAEKSAHWLAAGWTTAHDSYSFWIRYETLSRLSDKELTRRGFRRADIARIAFDETVGRR